MAGLQRDNARLTRRLARAEAIIEVQKKRMARPVCKRFHDLV
jgi:hypothetical protein